MTMSPLNERALTIIENYLAGEFASEAGWLLPSRVMTHITIESSWEPSVQSTDGLGSYGLMQVLPGTAAQMKVQGSQLLPENSILAGMRYLVTCKHILQHYRDTGATVFDGQPINPAIHAGASLDYDLVCAAYNEGPGNVLKGRADARYVDAFRAAYPVWTFVDHRLGVAPAPAPLPPQAAPPAAEPEPAPQPAPDPAHGDAEVASWVYEPAVEEKAADPAEAEQADAPPADTSAEQLNAAELAQTEDPSVAAAQAAVSASRKKAALW